MGKAKTDAKRTGTLLGRFPCPDKRSDKNVDDSSDPNAEYFVEAIVDHQIKKGRTLYLVKWQGYTNSLNEWLQEDMFVNDVLVSEYKKKVSILSEESEPKSGSKKRDRPSGTSNKSKKRIKKVVAAAALSAEDESGTMNSNSNAEEMEEDDEEEQVEGVIRSEDHLIPPKILKQKLWEDHLEVIAMDNRGEELLVVTKWKDGRLDDNTTASPTTTKKRKAGNQILLSVTLAREKCPQKIIDFLFSRAKFVTKTV